MRFFSRVPASVCVLQAATYQPIEQPPICSGLLRFAPVCSGLLRFAPVCSGLLRFAPARSTENGCDHLAMHIGEAEMTALVFEGQLFVIDTHQVENRRL